MLARMLILSPAGFVRSTLIAQALAFAEDWARLDTLKDLFRQISYDQRVHKEDSLGAMRRPRFS